LDDEPIHNNKNFVDVFHKGFRDRIGINPNEGNDKFQQEVQQTAASIRSIIDHFQDITDIDRTDNHYGDINILLDEITEEEITKINKNKKKHSTGS